MRVDPRLGSYSPGPNVSFFSQKWTWWKMSKGGRWRLIIGEVQVLPSFTKLWLIFWLVEHCFSRLCKRKMFSKLACDIHEIGTQNLDFFYNCHMITSTPCEVFEGEKTFCEWRVTLKKEVKSDFFLQPCPKYILLQSRDTIFSLQSHTQSFQFYFQPQNWHFLKKWDCFSPWLNTLNTT